MAEGSSVADLAAEHLNGEGDPDKVAPPESVAGDGEPEDDGTPQLILPGTGSKLNTSVGGKKPNESYFKMSSVSLPIAGGVQVEKDTEMWVAVPVAIDDVKVSNHRKDGQIVRVSRTHFARAIGQPIILEGPPVEE